MAYRSQESEVLPLVLLPGMDGTGGMFAAFLEALAWPRTEVVALPQEGDQSYIHLSHVVRTQLPACPFILLAESFSGAIAALLIQQGLPQLRGVVFAASFISPPPAWLINLALSVPLKHLMSWPGADWAIRYLMCAWKHEHLVEQLRQALKSVPQDVLHARIEALRTLNQAIDTRMFTTNLAPARPWPVLNLIATQDRLVSRYQAEQIARCYPWCVNQVVAGPHLLLQSAPGPCAKAVRAILVQGSIEHQDG